MQTLRCISVLSQTCPVFQCYFVTLHPWSTSLLPPGEVDVVWRQQPRCVMQALTFPTNAFLRSPRDICWPWRASKQCGFPGPLCGFSSYRKIYARIFVFQCFVFFFSPVLECVRCLQGWKAMVKIRPFRQGFVGTSCLVSRVMPYMEGVPAQQEFAQLCFSHELGGFLSSVGFLRVVFSSLAVFCPLYHTLSTTTNSLTCCRPVAFHPHLSLGSIIYLVKPYLRDRHLFWKWY